MPACLGASGSVRKRPNIQSAWWARLVQILWPWITHSPPSRAARLESEARSLLAPDELAAERGRDEAHALLLAAASEQRRREQRRPLEQDVAGRAGAPVLLA